MIKKLLGPILFLPFLLGIFLFAINIIGLSIPLRGQGLNNAISEKQFYDLIKRTNETDKEYIYKVNESVHKVIAQYWGDDKTDKYHLRVPFYKNFILYLKSFLAPKTYLKYEFCNYKYAIERGVGLCSQRSLIISGILSERGFNTKIASLTGHVVPLVQLKSGEWWVMGPSYNVIIEKSLEDVEKNPELIRPEYEKKYSKKIVDNLVNIFGIEGNKVFDGVSDYCGDNLPFENMSYTLIWVTPLLLIAPFAILKAISQLLKKH